MNRRMEKMRMQLLMQCLVVGLLARQSLAQHDRYPYSNTYDDGDDYDEQGRYDNHHPLDNQGHYNYGQPSQEHHYDRDSSPDLYDQYNSREDHQPEQPNASQEHQPREDNYEHQEREEIPDPHIITPPVSQNTLSRNMYEEHDSRVQQQPTDDRYAQQHTRTRDEFPEPHIITPPVSHDSRTNDNYGDHEPRDEHHPNDDRYAQEHESRVQQQPTDDRYAQEHTRYEFPEPRIITPPNSQDSRTNDMYEPHYTREEVPEPRNIAAPERPETHDQQTHDQQTHEPHYAQPERSEYETHEEYQPPRVITPPESQEPPTYETYEPLHARDESYDNRPLPTNKPTQVVSVPRLGSVRGYREFMVIQNRPISAYLGLKYGSVRSGIGRFQPAAPYQADPRSVIDATQAPSNCPQFPDLPIITRQEQQGRNVDDCLTLNIYAPARSGSYPVIVFVHGEMLFDGSAEEGQPDYFLEHDVVLVTINYRLAPFGFLSTLTDDMPGNVALSDIQMALEWVQHYISAFNGNSEQVTLMGQAAGATLIHALSISGKAQGLFHKLILQSGTALNPYFLDEQPLATLRSFANFARCPPSRNTEDFASCFERMSTTDLLTYFQRYFESNEPRGLAFANAYKLILGDKLGYLPQHPASMVANNAYPMIVGVTKDAGAFLMSRFYNELDQLRTRNISDYIMVVLKHTVQPRHYQIWKNWALQHIFNSEDIRSPNISNVVQKLLELINLILYRAPVVDSIRYTSQSYPTYLYCFDYRGEYHRFGHLRNPLPFEIDATLSDDNIFLFPYPEDVSRLNANDKSVARSMVSMWVNFAQYGVPDLDQSVWPRVTSEYGPFLRFTNGPSSKLEQDYHFGDGIPVPNLYPEYFTTTTTTTTTTPRPYRPYNEERPDYLTQQTSHPQQRPVYPNYPQYPNHRNSAQNQHAPNYRGLDNTYGNSRYSNYPMRH